MLFLIKQQRSKKLMSNIFNSINLNSGEEQKDKVLENVTSNISFGGALGNKIESNLLIKK